MLDQIVIVETKDYLACLVKYTVSKYCENLKKKFKKGNIMCCIDGRIMPSPFTPSCTFKVDFGYGTKNISGLVEFFLGISKIDFLTRSILTADFCPNGLI